MSKKIYITHSDDVTPEMACTVASIALVNTKPDDRKGVVGFNNGHYLSFNEKTKNLSMHVWRTDK